MQKYWYYLKSFPFKSNFYLKSDQNLRGEWARNLLTSSKESHHFFCALGGDLGEASNLSINSRSHYLWTRS